MAPPRFSWQSMNATNANNPVGCIPVPSILFTHGYGAPRHDERRYVYPQFNLVDGLYRGYGSPFGVVGSATVAARRRLPLSFRNYVIHCWRANDSSKSMIMQWRRCCGWLALVTTTSTTIVSLAYALTRLSDIDESDGAV